MRERLDPRAWLLWLITSLTVVFLLDHPVTDLVVILAAGLICTPSRRPTPFRSFLILGAVIVLVRTVLFALTGHTGSVTLAQIPALQLPDLLGGATLGGRVTGEVVASSIAEGLRILSVMACLGAFLVNTETAGLIRLLPRFLFEAGLVVSIAMAFAPQLARTAGDIRDAQRMRGERRKITPVIVPVLATALDRSIALAESMDSRGYGRAARGRAHPWGAISATLALTLAATGSFWALRRDSNLAAGATALALVLFIWSLAGLNRLVSRTRYRRSRFGRRETLVAAVVVTVVLAIAAPNAHYDPYRSLYPPAPNPLATLAAGILALPALATYRRRLPG